VAIAANGVQVLAATASAAPASTSFTAIGGTKSVDLSDSTNMLDTTAFNDGRLRRRLAGLRDESLSLSGQHEAVDVGWLHVLDALLGGSEVFVQFVYDGSNGFEFRCLVESVGISASVDGLVETTATLRPQAAPLAVT